MEPITEEVKIMLLLGFFSGFLFLTLLLHKRSEKLRCAVLIGYNFLFAAIVLTLRQLGGEAFSFEAVLNAFLRAIYATPMLITFNGDLSDTADVQDLIMILFISVYTFRTAVRLIFRKTVLAVKTGARVLFRSSVNILWGDGADAAAMIEEIRKNEKRAAVVWIPFDRDDAQEPDAFAATPDYFRKLRRRKRYTVYRIRRTETPRGCGSLNRRSPTERISVSPRLSGTTRFGSISFVSRNSISA